MSIVYNPQKEKIVSEPDEYLKLGQKKGYFILDGNKIKYLASGKKYSFLNPEEKVRAEYYFDLIEKYKYPPEKIFFEVEMEDRTPNRFADIVIYDRSSRPYIVIECKKDGITDAEFEQATKQVIANARVLKAPFAAVVAGNTRRAMETDRWNSQTQEKAIITDIPIFYGKVEEFRYKKGDQNWDLKIVDRVDLERALAKAHNTLWDGGKRKPIIAFDELCKIIFVKIRDEKRGRKIGDYYDFQIKTHEPAENVYKRINNIYLEAKEKDPEVFKDKLDVNAEELYKVVEHLQSISLNKTDLDVKGVAFERFMKKFFEDRESGQYFTPREIVNFAVKMMDIKNDDLVLDPACGSGGFLLHALDEIRQQAEEYEKNDAEAKYRYWHNFAQNNLFGIELNDSIARVAKMNMIIHDDGHTNVIRFDALEDVEKMTEKNHGFDKNHFDIIVTNPPFGANIARSVHPYLEKFFLGRKKDKKGKERLLDNQKTEILFIERCIEFLKFGTGKMAIVLPDGILTNSSLQTIRDFLMEQSQILAIVSLPQFTFMRSGAGVKSSLVFVRKKGENEKLGKYPIFMAIAEHIGYDATGRKDSKNDLNKIYEEFGKFREKTQK